MERVTECLVTKSGFVKEPFPDSGCVETSVRSSQLSSSPGPLDPQHPTGVPFLPGDNIARTRVMLTADPTRKAPMTHGLLNNSSVAQAQDRERPELTRWLFCGQGIHAERGECPTSAMHIGVSLRGSSRGLGTACSFAKCERRVNERTSSSPHPIDETDTLAAVPFGTPIGGTGGSAPGPGHETSGKLDGSREESLSSHPLSALLGETPLVISAHSPSSECVPSAPTYTFQSLPITPAHPIPTSEGHDGAAPSREGEHPCKAENSALVRLAHSRVALFHSISAPLLGALRCCPAWSGITLHTRTRTILRAFGWAGLCLSQQAGGQVRNNFGISALLGLEIGENSLTASKPHSCTSFLNGFSSDPVCAVTPAPEVVFFQAGPLCLRLPMTITPTLGPLCDFSAYLLVYVPAPRVFS
ncbi:hypothetical protein PAPYR_7133 [Paratrimastix pyriformis]|uniref:Uncharacterized protein n=1 Tax=Paratrimastix pyriformis TaxID=342808 RepID=A0ABQ8UI85_9EUKA|nr:hypothetical protein PAPYR_7133 [Paratrimastix pyriformis]